MHIRKKKKKTNEQTHEYMYDLSSIWAERESQDIPL